MAKKQTRTILLVLLLGGVAYWLSKRTLNKITYSAGGFRVHKLSGAEVEFRVKMTILNQSDIPAPISAFIGQLLYMGSNGPSVLGQLKLVSPAQLPGFGQVELEFSMKSGLLGTGYELLNILTNGNPTDISKVNYGNIDTKRFKIIGTLKVGPVPVDINTTLV